MDFYKECKNTTLEDIKKKVEYTTLPKTIKNKANRLKNKKELCKLLSVAHEANKEGNAAEFFSLVQVAAELSSLNPIESVQMRPPVPTKYLKVIKPTYRFYHGRSVTRSANIWNSSKDFKRVMWWAIDRLTPLMYASTSIKGRELDSSLRWDLYEARTRKDEKLLVISKESIEWITEHFGNIQCEGKTVGWWINEAFPIVKGKLHRVSYVASDRKMAKCLCENIGAIGYIAPEIKVKNGNGELHKEALFCNPERYLRLKKFMVFTTKKSQASVEEFLNGNTSTLKPDIVKMFK